MLNSKHNMFIMTYEIRKIGSMRGVVIDGRIRSNLFSNPFEFKMLENCAYEADIRRYVFMTYAGMFSLKKSERKLGFLRVFYDKKQLGLIDNGIFVITLSANDPERLIAWLTIDELTKDRKEYALYNSVVKNKDVIMSICKAKYDNIV